MNYEEALQYLDKIREYGAKLELNNIQKIIDNFPFDLKKKKFIQVAGTNGKGSTSHFITSILIKNGYTTGLFTSPHLLNIRERITINKTWITKDDFAQALGNVKNLSEKLLDKGSIQNPPTYFEHLFLTSLYYFCMRNADFIVLEVGLGGRLDATSTITPVVSVITNISKDHTKTLGPNIKDIAAEKAGIIKHNVPVVVGSPPNSTAAKVIKKIAKNLNAPVYFVYGKNSNLDYITEDNHYLVKYSYRTETFTFKVLLNGRHQIDNANTSLMVSILLKEQGIDLKKKKIFSGIESNFVPGRVEIFSKNPYIIIDSSHNEESIKALSEFLKEKGKKGMTLVFGVLRDKNYKKMADYLKPYVENIILTEPDSKRALPAEKLISHFNGKNTVIIKNYEDVLKKAKLFKNDILITGSFYLSGKMKNLLSGGII